MLLALKFDCNGLIPVVTTHVNTGEVLMHPYMNGIINKDEALLCYISFENDYHSQKYPPQPSKQTCFGVKNNKVAGKVRNKL